MLRITLDQAERIVEKRNDLHWDGWTIVQTRPHSLGMMRPDGVFDRKTRKWNVAKRYDLDPKGLYSVPKALGHGL